MGIDRDLSTEYQQRIQDAAAIGQHVALHGGNSKAFYGREVSGEPFDLSGHRGIVSYEPTELVITARAGTPLQEIEAALAEKGQMLPFEPPHFSPNSTIGGAIACGLSGPRRPWGGAPRDLLLGIKLLDGKGQILNFGGQVMKNVAGYDLSRLMAGAMGSLGILLEVSIKVLPAPAQEHTLQFEANEKANRTVTLKMLNKGLPISASYAYRGVLRVRFACSEARFKEIRTRFGGEPYTRTDDFWARLCNQQLDYFQDAAPLWRLSLPQTAPLNLGSTLNEWTGAQRWLKSERSANEIRLALESQGGHAIMFRNGDRSGEIFHPLQDRLLSLQRQLKTVFDPQGIFNPGRLYTGF